MPKTRAVNSAPYARLEDAALLGLHLGNLAGQHHEHQRARVIGGVDEIAQAFGNGDARVLGIAHVFIGDGAGQRGDVVRRVPANAAIAGAA